MKSIKLALKLSTLIALFAIPISVITIPNQPATAQCTGSGPCNDTNLQAVCDTGECVIINSAYQSGNKAVFKFSGGPGTNFFNVRYRNTKGGETQVENRSGYWTVNNVLPHRRYTISVQGCVSHTFSRSTCSGWSSRSVTTY
jgi:hypothetical protein